MSAENEVGANAEVVQPDQPEAPPVAQNAQGSRRGLPVWMPLLGLVAALAFAVLVLTRICPVLSGLVFPPDPPLPAGDVRELQPRQNTGVGRDEWLYGTNVNACEVIRFYEDRIGGCQYDANINCTVGGGRVPDLPGVALPAGVCQGKQSIGAMQITWTVRIATNYNEGGVTHFRITREVTN